MIIKCAIKLNDNGIIENSFKRFVFCNLHLGVQNNHKNKIKKEPYLIAVTLSRTLKYKVVNNIKKIITKELINGKCSIIFQDPPHCILIQGNKEELKMFLKLLHNLLDKNRLSCLEDVHTLPGTSSLKFVSKSKEKSSNNVTKCNTNEDTKNIIMSKIICPKLRAELMKNLQELHLSNSNINNLPIELGRISWIDIDLEGNNLCNIHLSWLEELPIRKSLVKLNLSKNKLSAFPSAVVDFFNLQSLNLRNNAIQHIPGEIGCLRQLKYLNLSENNLHYLPFGITYLQLDVFDVTDNFLTNNNLSNTNILYSAEFKHEIRLEHLAVTSVNSTLRSQQTIKECPVRLLEKLRYVSKCICGKTTFPHSNTFFYYKLGRIKFASTYWIHPQRNSDIVTTEQNIFLQYHLCSNLHYCEAKHRVSRFVFGVQN